MKYLAILLGLFLSSDCAAQFFAGATTGASYWESIEAVEGLSPLQQRRPISWEKGITLRYEAPKWFAVEIAILHFSMGMANVYAPWSGNSLPASNKRDQFFDYAISFQSALTYKPRNFKHYIGWTFTYGSHKAYEGNYGSWGGSGNQYLRFRYGGAGITHYMRRPITNHLHVSLRSSLSLVASGSSFVSEVRPRFQSLLSVLYKFW